MHVVVQLMNTQQWSLRIIGNNSLKLPSVENTKSSQLIFDYIQGNVCSRFTLYFENWIILSVQGTIMVFQ